MKITLMVLGRDFGFWTTKACIAHFVVKNEEKM